MRRIIQIAQFGGKLTAFVALAILFAGATNVAAQEFKFLEVKVFDENGKPMVDVPVDIKMDGLSFPMPTDEQGMISLNVSAGNHPVELQVQHPGYESQKIRWRRGSEVPAEHLVKMKPGKPSGGWVVDAAGNPVAGAEVYAAQPDKPLTFLNGRNPSGSKQVMVTTDEQGRFTLPFQPVGSTIVCLSDAGWSQFVIPKEQGKQPLDIQLTHWVVVQLMTKHPEETVGLHFLNTLPKDQGKVKWLYEGNTDKQRQFRFDRVISGSAMAYRRVPLQLATGQPDVDNRSHGKVVHLKAGEHVQVTIGLAKQKATGTLIIPVEYIGKPNWESGYVALAENNVVNLAMRTMIFEYGKLLSQSNVYDPRQRVPPSLHPNYLVRYLARVRSDGSFELEGVPAGQYKLSAMLTAQPVHEREKTDVLSLEDLPFTIPKLDGETSFDLGEHILEHTDSFAK